MSWRVKALFIFAMLALILSAWLSWSIVRPSLTVEEAQRLQAEELRAIARSTPSSKAVKPLYHPPDGFVQPNLSDRR